MAATDAPHRRYHPFEEHRPAITEARVHVLAYGPEGVEEAHVDSLDAALEHVGRHPAVWINVTGTEDPRLLEGLEAALNIHPLVTEDIRHTRQRPKVEDYDAYTYVTTRMATLTEWTVETEQVSLILGDGYLVTVQERPGDVFDGIRDRIRQGRPRIRGSGPDYLAYALLDAVVDQYFPMLEALGDHIDALEDSVFETPDGEVLEEIQRARRLLVLMRRTVWPQRDALQSLLRGDSPRFTATTRLYLRDVADHAHHVLETLETYRELASGVRDTYLNQVSQRTNDVMRVLTIVATIFIPLTFLAGIWGMNFQHMPELANPWAYPAVLATMLLIAAGQLVYFRRRGWL